MAGCTGIKIQAMFDTLASLIIPGSSQLYQHIFLWRVEPIRKTVCAPRERHRIRR